jgi:hypothetical protein
MVQKDYKTLPEYIDIEFEKDVKWNVILYKSEIYVLWTKKSEWFATNKKRAQEESAKHYYETLFVSTSK